MNFASQDVVDGAPVADPIDWHAELSAPDVGMATRMLLRVLLLGALGTFSLMYLSWYMMPIGVVLMGLCFYGLQVISYDCNRACYLPWSGANTILGAAVSLPLLRSTGAVKIGADPLQSMMFAASRHAPVWILAVGLSIAAIANGHTLLLLKFWLIPFLAMHLSAAGSFFFACCGIQSAGDPTTAGETGTESAFSLLFPEINLHVPEEMQEDVRSPAHSRGTETQTKTQALAAELHHFDQLLQCTPIYKLPRIAKRVTELASTFFSRHSELDNGEQEQLIALLNRRIESVSPIQRIVRQFLFWNKRDWAMGAAVAIFAGLAVLKWSLANYDVPWAENLPEYGWLPLLIVLPCFSLLSSAPKSLEEMQAHIKNAMASLSEGMAAVSSAASSAQASPALNPIAGSIQLDHVDDLGVVKPRKLAAGEDSDEESDDNFPVIYHRRNLQPHLPNATPARVQKKQQRQHTPSDDKQRARRTPLKQLTPSHVMKWMQKSNMSNLAAQWQKAGFVVDGELLAHAESAEDVDGLLSNGVPGVFRRKLLSMIRDARDGGVDLELLLGNGGIAADTPAKNNTAEAPRTSTAVEVAAAAAVNASAVAEAVKRATAEGEARLRSRVEEVQRSFRSKLSKAEERASRAEATATELRKAAATAARQRDAESTRHAAARRREQAEVAELRQLADTRAKAVEGKQRIIETLQTTIQSQERRLRDSRATITALKTENATLKREINQKTAAAAKSTVQLQRNTQQQRLEAQRLAQHQELKAQLSDAIKAREDDRRKAEEQTARLVEQLRKAGYNATAPCTAADKDTTTKSGSDDRIAVIGYSCILPGGENATESWEMIRDGLDNIRDIPDDRVDVTAYYNPDKTVPDKIYCTRGGFIPDFDFNPREFNFNMLQMEDTDVNQTLTLVKVKEALHSAGIPCSTVKGKAVEKSKKNIGCVLGIGGGQKASHEFYSRLNYTVVEKVLRKMKVPEQDIAKAVEKYKANFPEWRLDSFPGFLGNVTSGRVTNVFNLDGMNCVVDAACASSLIAIKVAMDEILSGDCETMIAGATCTDCSLGMYMAFSKTPVFSRKQSVTAYDKDTGGMLIGEGSVMFVLKRLSAAEAAGDKIHAVIRACASSSDGKAPGIYAPTISGQEQAIRRAYERAGVDPASVTLVEGHGTGTPVGDAVELTALKNVLGEGPARESDPRRQRVAVGSIKSNIGHLKSVAGCAGLIKVVMALKHKILPETINVDIPPKLRDGTTIQESALYINTSRRPWFTRPGVPRRAGVSSFGFGGANYHCVVEEYESEYTSGSEPYRVHNLPAPVVISARNASALALKVQAEIKKLLPHQENAPAKSAGHRQALGAQAPEPKTLDKMRAARAFESFKHSFALRGGANAQVPTPHARVGFLADNLQQTLEVLQALPSKLKKSGVNAWHLPKHKAYFRASGLAPSQPGKSDPTVAALFTGQGAQYVNMFSDVAQNWPEMRRRLVEMDKAFANAHGKFDS